MNVTSLIMYKYYVINDEKVPSSNIDKKELKIIYLFKIIEAIYEIKHLTELYKLITLFIFTRAEYVKRVFLFV